MPMVENWVSLPGRRSPILLELDLTEPLVTGDADDPLARLQARGRRQLRPTLRALHEASDDRRVVGLIARIGGLPWALSQELRLGVQAFAASGKPTVAWTESFGEGSQELAAYVLATGFDEIWLQPTGSVGALGVGIETTFLRGALDKVGIEPQFEQRYEYKNAADRLTRTDFTPAHRESLERLASSIFTDAVAAIAAGRDLALERVRELVDAGPHTAAGGARGGSGRPARLPRRGLRRVALASPPTTPTCCSPTAGTGAGRPALAGPPAEARRSGRRARGDHRPGRTPATDPLGRQAGSDTRRRRAAGGGQRVTTCRRSCSASTHPAGRPSPRTRSGARSAGCGRPASRWWCRWATSPPPAATTSPAAADRSSPSRLDPDRLDRRVRRQVRAAGSAGSAGPEHRDRRRRAPTP